MKRRKREKGREKIVQQIRQTGKGREKETERDNGRESNTERE